MVEIEEMAQLVDGRKSDLLYVFGTGDRMDVVMRRSGQFPELFRFRCGFEQFAAELDGAATVAAH